MKKGTGAAYACLMVVFFCWGSVYVANGYILRVLTSTELACCRFVVAAAVLGSVMLVRRMATRSIQGAEIRTNGAQGASGADVRMTAAQKIQGAEIRTNGAQGTSEQEGRTPDAPSISEAEPGVAHRILPGDWKFLFLVGFLGYYLTMECTVFSVEYAGSSLASLVNSLNPVLISVFAALFLGETLSRRKMICLGVSLVGVYIVSGGAGSGGKATGVLIGIGALIAWAWATVYIRRLSQRIPSLTITFIGVVVSLLFHIPTAAFSVLHHGMPVISFLQNTAAGSAGAAIGAAAGSAGAAVGAAGTAAAAGTRVLTGKVLLCILYSGAFGTAIPQFLWGFCLSRLPASTCSSFYPMMPVFSAILGVTLLGETLGPSFFIGGALIVVAVIISCLQLPSPVPRKR